MRLNAFIVDDESHSRKILKTMLLEFNTRVNVVGTAHDIPHAMAAFQELPIDILFLDVNLGGGATGFDLLDKLKTYRFDVVFVTAYDNHSLKAFDYAAVHYLLKPVDATALCDTLSRTAGRKMPGQIPVNNSPSELLTGAPDTPRVALSDSGKTEFVSMHDIEYLEGRGSYTAFFLKDRACFVRSKNLKYFEDALAAYPSFVRVHKSYMINRDKVRAFRKVSAELELHSGAVIPVSLNYRDLMEQLGGYLIF